MNNDISVIINKIRPQLIADRRTIHQNPELSFQEFRTMEYICNRLDELGISYRKEIAGTGVLAEVHGKMPGKCLLIRADMDALALDEKNETPYSSQNQGVMHACGHDAHTAILLNTCEVLSSLKERWCGTIKFAFQPGEETTGGAEPMIREGILENPKVDACIALHMDTDLNTGTIRVKEGAMYASPDDFAITIKGKGGHGAEPQNAIDPIVIAAHIITQLQTVVGRNVDPFEEAVVTIGSIHAGHATNIIPDTAELQGTARAFTNEMRNMLSERIQSIVKNTCLAHGADYDYRFVKLFPPLSNNAEIAKGIYESAIRCLGEENCIWGGRPTMAGEDFAYFSQEVPSGIFKLGCRNESRNITAPLHNPYFDIDEASLEHGVAIFTDFALHYLEEPR
ncbi:MAG: amidohydrolase [Clostridia bacterium]|nr:amidohydrolase [Clostridia bacterium]